MPYPGSKAGAGVAERIIAQMPPHHTYVELFAGSACVFMKKRPAARSVLVDVDPFQCSALSDALAAWPHPWEVRCNNAMQIVSTEVSLQDPETLVYADPPYLRETRTKLYYRHELHTGIEHGALLSVLCSLRCMVMISGYASSLYESMLEGWRLVTMKTMTRGGARTECLWCNFPEPQALHDPRYAGQDFRQRERIKRKRQRWQRRFQLMEPRERQAVAEALATTDRATLVLALRASPTEGKADETNSGEATSQLAREADSQA